MRNTEVFGLSIKAGLAMANKLPLEEALLKTRIDNTISQKFSAFVQESSELSALRCQDQLFTDDYGLSLSKSEVNFITADNKTLNVWTGLSHKLKICPKGVGQPGRERASEIFADWLKGCEANKENFKEIVLRYPDEILSMYLEALLAVDINLFVWPSRSGESFKYSIIRTDEVEERKIEKDEISFTKSSVDEWNESNTVKVHGRTVGEFQVHSSHSRFIKFRFDIAGLDEVLCQKKRDNALVGRTLEHAIGQAAGISMPEMPIDRQLTSRIQRDLEANPDFQRLNIHSYCGNLEGSFRPGSRSPVDFLCKDGKTLSVKSIKGRSGKICAPEVGQPSPNTFDYYFGEYGLYEPPIDQDKFRRFVVDHTSLYLQMQAKWLFDCDYLFLMINVEGPEYYCLSRKDLSVLSLRLEQAVFSFSVKREDWLIGAKYSMTVYDSGEACGEIQVHKNRSSLKFRFNSSYLLSRA